MSRQTNKLYEVQRNVGGDWMPVLLPEKKGKKRESKTVRITEATAEAMNVDAESWKGPRNPHLRYVLVEESQDGGDDAPKFADMKKALKEAGVQVSNKAKKDEVTALYNEHIAGE